jgi:CHAD domain-containing protein
VCGRRLRAALPLLVQKSGGKRARRALRALKDMTRAAGASRDLDVCAETLDEYLKSPGASADEGEALRRRLRAARKRSRARMADALLDLDIADLRRDLRELRSRDGADEVEVMERIGAQRDRLGGWVQETLAGLGDSYEPEVLHTVRRRVRRLRYTAEICRELRGERSEAAKAFKQQQEILGRINDYYVLGQWAGQQAETAVRRGRSKLGEAAGSLQQWANETSRQTHREWLQQDPQARLRRAVTTLVPLVSVDRPRELVPSPPALPDFEIVQT